MKGKQRNGVRETETEKRGQRKGRQRKGRQRIGDREAIARKRR